jgi:short-subunit dehydrogenase
VELILESVLITGASSGIGKELALLLATKRIKLILVGRNFEALRAVADDISHKTEVLLWQADLGNENECTELLSLIHEQVPDCVVNCAGCGVYEEVLHLPFQELEEVINVNCRALVRISQGAALALKDERKKGVILNVSSALAFFPCPLAAVYAASKAFVNSFSEAFDAELRKFGIRVLVSCPGQVATPFVARASRGAVPTGEPSFSVLSAKKVAEEIWLQIQKHHAVRVIDWKYRWLVGVAKWLPRWFVKRVLKFSLRSRIPEKK